MARTPAGASIFRHHDLVVEGTGDQRHEQRTVAIAIATLGHHHDVDDVLANVLGFDRDIVLGPSSSSGAVSKVACNRHVLESRITKLIGDYFIGREVLSAVEHESRSIAFAFLQPSVIELNRRDLPA